MQQVVWGPMHSVLRERTLVERCRATPPGLRASRVNEAAAAAAHHARARKMHMVWRASRTPAHGRTPRARTEQDGAEDACALPAHCAHRRRFDAVFARKVLFGYNDAFLAMSTDRRRGRVAWSLIIKWLVSGTSLKYECNIGAIDFQFRGRKKIIQQQRTAMDSRTCLNARRNL